MIEQICGKKAFICDMDGVIYHGRRLLEGVGAFMAWLRREGKEFLFLTNSSALSPAQLRRKLARMGIEAGEDHFMTSAIATASFLKTQRPGARIYMIGGPGLREALEEAGFILTEENPDYVVLGETEDYDYAKLVTAIQCVLRGARLIGTNPDVTGPGERGIMPACRAMMAPIELSTGKPPYYIGKPNPLIMRHSLRKLGCRREEAAIIGDRMDTDIIAGIESEIQTVLVLSGITRRDDLDKFAYRPDLILNHVGELAT